MCLIGFHWRPGTAERLILAGNRDEFRDRPASPLDWWEGGRILAGRDLRGGGTWLGVTRDGRLAALTNHRDPALGKPAAPSRGLLPLRFLQGGEPAEVFLAEVRREAGAFSPFNLLLCDGRDLLGYESRRDRLLRFDPGVHVVSNGAFDEPWPKAAALRADFAALEHDDEALLDRLQDARTYPDGDLPRTGVPLAWERLLSAAFIPGETYGTLASTVVRLGRTGGRMAELRHGPQGPEGRTDLAW